MTIKHSPLKPKQDWKWVFIWNRQIGEFKVRCEWLKYRYLEKGGLNYAIEYRNRNDQLLHTEFGQHEPDW